MKPEPAANEEGNGRLARGPGNCAAGEPPAPLLLENLPWPEIAELRGKNGGLLLLPLGATEQHGPHLPVAMDTLLADSDDPDRTPGTVFSHPVAQTSLNGVTGHPSRATAEQGRVLYEAMVAALVTTVGSAIREEPPLAPEHWTNLPEVPHV